MYTSANKYLTINLDVDPDLIYEIVMGKSTDLSAETNSKLAYFHTFKKDTV